MFRVNKIVGGVETLQHEFPWMAGVTKARSKHVHSMLRCCVAGAEQAASVRGLHPLRAERADRGALRPERPGGGAGGGGGGPGLGHAGHRRDQAAGVRGGAPPGLQARPSVRWDPAMSIRWLS